MTHRDALVVLHAAVALFGLAALFGQWVTLPATLIVLGRTTIAAVTLAILAYARREPLRLIDRRLLANGAVLALHWVSFFAAVKLASVAIALLGYATFPVFVLALTMRAATRVTRRDCATAALATLGLVAIVPALSWSSDATRGLALGVVSGFTFAWLAVRNQSFVATRSAAAIALWQNVGAALCLVPVALVVAPSTHPPSLVDVALLVVLGVVCTGVAHTLFIASMRRLSVHTASVVASLEPVYGIALAAWLLHQVPDVRTVVGGALIVTAALLASQRSLGEARAVSVASGEARIGQ